jgi:hypothetical protein
LAAKPCHGTGRAKAYVSNYYSAVVLLYCFSSAKPGSVHGVQLAEAVWPPFKQPRVLILTPSFLFNVDIEHEEIACIFELALSHEAG